MERAAASMTVRYAISCALVAGSAAANKSKLTINTVSARPEHASAGNVLVRIDVPSNAALSDVHVTLNGAVADAKRSSRRVDPVGLRPWIILLAVDEASDTILDAGGLRRQPGSR